MIASPFEIRRLGAPAFPRILWVLARPSNRTLAVAALVGAALLWGTSFVAAKGALAAFPPVTLTLLRFVVALAILDPLVRRRGQRPLGGRQAMLLGLTGVALPLACQNVGLRFGEATNGTLLFGGATPILATMLGVIVLGERLSTWSLVGLIASAAGVATVVVIGAGGIGITPRSDGLFLLGATSCAVYVVAARRVFAKGDLLATLAGMARCAVLFLLPAAGVELAAVGIGVPDPRSVLLVIFLGAGCSALAFALSAFGARHLKAGQCSVILNVEVPIGVAAGAMLLQEPIAAGQVVGGLLIVTGAVLIMRPARPRQARARDGSAARYGWSWNQARSRYARSTR